jgi:hypothetical protein
MAIIGVVGFGIAFLVLLWNKRLESTVNARTTELKEANYSLTKSNRLLAEANEQLKVHDAVVHCSLNMEEGFTSLVTGLSLVMVSINTSNRLLVTLLFLPPMLKSRSLTNWYLSLNSIP